MYLSFRLFRYPSIFSSYFECCFQLLMAINAQAACIVARRGVKRYGLVNGHKPCVYSAILSSERSEFGNLQQYSGAVSSVC